MPKINFKDYIENYKKIKIEEKNNKKVNDLKYQTNLAKQINQKYYELKEYLEILKNNLNTGSMSETEVKNNIRDNINNIQALIRDTYDLCKKNKIYSDYIDTLKATMVGFLISLATLIGAIIIESVIPISWVKWLFQILTVFGLYIFDEFFVPSTFETGHYFKSGFKILMGLLPFNNRYNFIKNFSKLKKLEKEYEKLEKQYTEYLKYLDSTEKSKVGESIIKGKEVKDLYLLEITKLADKVKELPLGSDRNKYLDTLENLTELYKREKERIILKNGRVHSEEESEFKMSILKQIAYIEMEINNSLYKSKNVDLLTEDYLTTLGYLDTTKDKKLERTLSLGK